MKISVCAPTTKRTTQSAIRQSQASNTRQHDLPFSKPILELYPGDLGLPYLSNPSTKTLFPSNWCQNIICFAPVTHLDVSSSHHTGGWAGASGRGREMDAGRGSGKVRSKEGSVTVHLKPCIYMLGSPQPLGTQPYCICKKAFEWHAWERENDVNSYSTDTPIQRTRREVWDLIRCDAFPWGAAQARGVSIKIRWTKFVDDLLIQNAKHDEILRRYFFNVRYVGNSKRRPSSHRLVLGVH